MNEKVNEVNQEIYKPVKTNRLWMILVLGTLTAIGPLSIDMYLRFVTEVNG